MVVVREASSAEPIALFHARHVGLAGAHRFVRPGWIPLAGVTECRINPNLTPGLAFAGTLDDRDRTEACRAFEVAVHRYLGWRRYGLAYRYLLDEHLPVVPASGRIRLRLSPAMVLRNEWPDRASYLRSLPSKWRSRLTKIHSTIRDDDRLQVTIVDAVAADEASWLTSVVSARYQSRALPRPPIPAGYFRQLSRLPGFRFLTYRDPGDRLLGFSTFYDDGRDMVLLWWGARGEKDGWHRDLYFDQYFRLVEVMVSAGRRTLHLGTGMLEIKSRYGARPQQRWGLVGLQ